MHFSSEERDWAIWRTAACVMRFVLMTRPCCQASWRKEWFMAS